MKTLTHVNYPWHTVVLSNVVSMSIYLLGLYLLVDIQIWLAAIFLLYILFLELRLLNIAVPLVIITTRFVLLEKEK